MVTSTCWFSHSSNALLWRLTEAIQLAPEGVQTTAQLLRHVLQNASTGRGFSGGVRAIDAPVSAEPDRHPALWCKKVAAARVGVTPDHRLIEGKGGYEPNNQRGCGNDGPGHGSLHGRPDHEGLSDAILTCNKASYERWQPRWYATLLPKRWCFHWALSSSVISRIELPIGRAPGAVARIALQAFHPP